MAGTVLLVEDEPSVGELVRAYLTRDGYRVVWVRSGEEALTELDRHPVRMVLLDIGLPGKDGFDVCREIRTRSQVPILMLTARDEEPDRVVGLELGADDYLTKPFELDELFARLRVLIRRGHQVKDPVLRVRDLEIDTAARNVKRAGKTIHLTPREYALLQFLAFHRGRVVSRTMIRSRPTSYCALSARGPCMRASPRAFAASNSSVVSSAMEPSPSVQQFVPMSHDQPHDPARVLLVAADQLPDFAPDQIDHYEPSRPKDVHVGRGMIVRIDHHPQATDAQDRGHDPRRT